MAVSELDKISEQIQTKQEQITKLQGEIEELQTKAHDSVRELMKKFGIDGAKGKKSGSAPTNKSAEVKAEIAKFLKNKKDVSKDDLTNHLKKQMGLKTVLLHHYKDVVKTNKSTGVVSLTA